MQTWYCSVSFSWKTTLGGGGATRGGLARAGGRAARPSSRPSARRARRDARGRRCPPLPRRGCRRRSASGGRPAIERRLMLEITSAVPMTGRPSGWLPNDRLGDQVVHRLLRRILVHRNLLEDHLALRVEVDERRREHHVRHDVERRLDVLVHDPCVDDRVLTRRGCVQLAAETVEDLGDLLGRIGRVPLNSMCSRKWLAPAFASRPRHASRHRSRSRSRLSERRRAARVTTRSPSSSALS